MSDKPQAQIRPDALTLFTSKHPTLERVIDYRCMRKHLSADQREVLQQEGALRLWTQCRRAADPAVPWFEISCDLLANAAFSSQLTTNARQVPTTPLVPGMEGEPVHRSEAAIDVDGMTISATESRMDDPVAWATFENGITMPEMCHRLGLCRERVRQLAGELGGRQMGTRWYFPPEAGLGRKRGQKSPRAAAVSSPP